MMVLFKSDEIKSMIRGEVRLIGYKRILRLTRRLS
jgi:hypothetical protein